MKIMIFSTAFPPGVAHGGVPIFTFYLAKALHELGAEVKILTSDRDGDSKLPATIERNSLTFYQGIPVIYFKTCLGPYMYEPRLYKIVAEEARDTDCIINSGTLWNHAGLVSWYTAHKKRIPSITYLHGLLDPWAFNYKYIRKRTYWSLLGKRIVRDSSVVAALTNKEKEIIRELGYKNRIEIIPVGVSINNKFHTATREKLEESYPELKGCNYVLYLGRIHKKKGIDVLLYSLKDIIKSYPKLYCVLAGPVEREYEKELKKLILASGFDDHIILTGKIDDQTKWALYKFAEVFVLPSHSEGLPAVVLEAMISSCPVIISENCNLPEVAENDAGMIVNVEIEPLKKTLKLILGNQDLRNRMARNAYKLAENRFNWDMIGQKVYNLCNQVSNGTK